MDDFDTALGKFAKGYLEAVMLEAGGVVAKAAKIAGLGRTNMYRYLHYYDIDFPRRPAHRGDWGRPITPEAIAERLGPPSSDPRRQARLFSKIRQ